MVGLWSLGRSQKEQTVVFSKAKGIAGLTLGALLALASTTSADVAMVDDATALADQADSFKVSTSNASAAVGQQGTISVVVTALGVYKPNEKYPHKVKKLAGDGVSFGAKSVGGSVSGSSISYQIPVTPDSAGQHAVTGQIRFSVCNAEQCLIKKLPLTATVTGT